MPILYFKALKDFVKIHMFRMELIHLVVTSLHWVDFLAFVNIIDALLRALIHHGYQQFLQFIVGRKHYQFEVFPLNIAMAP